MTPRERPPRPSPIATTTAERLATIIEAAERAASAVVDNAHAHAQRYLEEAQAEADRTVAARLASLAELTDALVAQAEAVRRQTERLLESLEQVSTQLELAPGPDGAGEDRKGPHLAAVSPSAQPPIEEAGAGPRLLATQMAVSGSSREEIESRLRSGFEIEDTAAILDAILGPEE